MVEQLSRSESVIDPGDEPGSPLPGRPDLAIGAFTPHGPWTVEPENMAWRFPSETGGDIDSLRSDAADLARQLVRPQRLPPGARVVDDGFGLTQLFDHGHSTLGASPVRPSPGRPQPAGGGVIGR